ncbi:integrase [Mycobacteroides chelonae]|nr:integrase [Mycobacteroides chelonae]
MYAYLINTDDNSGSMAALGALSAPAAKPSYGANVIPLHG